MNIQKRYAIVGRYMNNQTDQEWESMLGMLRPVMTEGMNVVEAIEFHVEQARRLALAEIERHARCILLKHKNLREFIMGMGIASFTDGTDEDHDSIALYDREYMKPLWGFICDWDDTLHLTGEPMRFTATGEKVTDW